MWTVVFCPDKQIGQLYKFQNRMVSRIFCCLQRRVFTFKACLLSTVVLHCNTKAQLATYPPPNLTSTMPKVEDKKERLIPRGTEDSAADYAGRRPASANGIRASSASASNHRAQAVEMQRSKLMSKRSQEEQMISQLSNRSRSSTRPNNNSQKKSTTNGGPARKTQVKQLLTSDDESYVYEEKKGHKLFFFLCDTKRAVLILSTLNFFLLALTMARNFKNAKANGVAFDISNEFTKKFVTHACSLFVDCTTILGAMWYSPMIVAVGFSFDVYQLVVSSMSAAQNWVDNPEYITTVTVLAALNVMNLYALGAFMWEVHKGVLTKETYQKREKYSCCCEC